MATSTPSSSSSSSSSSEDDAATAMFRSVAVSAETLSAAATASQEASKRRHARALQRAKGGGASIARACAATQNSDDGSDTEYDGMGITHKKVAALLHARLGRQLDEMMASPSSSPERPSPTPPTNDGAGEAAAAFALFTRIVPSKREASPPPPVRRPAPEWVEPDLAACAAVAVSAASLAAGATQRARSAVLGPTRWPDETGACMGQGKAHVRAVLARMKAGEKVACPHLAQRGVRGSGEAAPARGAPPPPPPVSSKKESQKRRLKRAAQRAAKRLEGASSVPQAAPVPSA
ncbi:hypothetical protein ACKKBG_A18770 [Auxenochlorella protothecoides x Auxenochlorella symbiontica]